MLQHGRPRRKYARLDGTDDTYYFPPEARIRCITMYRLYVAACAGANSFT